MFKLLVCLSLLLTSAGVVKGGSGPATTKSTAAPVSSAARPSDAEIEQKIRMKLAKSKIGLDGFVAKVRGGVVTWEGRTGVPQHKGAATRMAKSSGAVRVVNNIQISNGAKPGQPLRHAQIQPGQNPAE